MRETRKRSFCFLKDRRTVIASADRVFNAALTHLFNGIGPLVGAATSEQDALNCLIANDVQLLVCTDLLDSESGPALANRSLDAKQVSQKQRRTVNKSPGFEDLMKRYINQQGGCEAIIKDFQ